MQPKPSSPIEMPAERPRGRPPGTAVPPASDPRWEAWCAPLLAFLSERRDWKALLAWARARRLAGNRLRNQLAWLEWKGCACSAKERGTGTGFVWGCTCLFPVERD